MKVGIRNTHQRLAYEALKYLPDERRSVLEAYFAELLDGSTAPDRKFKDFRNHVLHPSDRGLRGGAIEAAKERFSKAAEYGKQRDRKRFAFAMGVLSHYVADPTMPLHTAQEPGEENVHKFYERATSELRRTRDIRPAARPEDISGMLADSARRSYEKYRTIMRLYDPERGKPFKRSLGYNAELRAVTAGLLSLALGNIVTVRRRVISELESAGVRPDISPGIVSAIKAALKALAEFLRRLNAERELARMRSEISKYGSVRDPDEEQKAYARIFSDARRLGLYRPPTKGRPKYRLEPGDPVEKAPGIGKKSAARLGRIGVRTVMDLLRKPDSELAKAIRNPERVKCSTRLMLEIPGLLAREAEALARIGICSREELLERDLKELTDLMGSLAGEKYRGKPLALSEEEIRSIVERAREGRDIIVRFLTPRSPTR